MLLVSPSALTKKKKTICTIFILQSFWFHLHDLQNQNQNCLLVTLQTDNHSPGSGRLVPSSHQRTILSTFSRGDKRIWKCIPIPNDLWGKATLIKISIYSNGNLICHRMMIPAAPSQGNKVICWYTGFTLQLYIVKNSNGILCLHVFTQNFSLAHFFED